MTPEERYEQIDKRLDRLTERQEATAESLELLRINVDALSGKVDELTDTVAAHEKQWEKFRKAMAAGLRAWIGDEPAT